MAANFLKRELAPISQMVWEEIDEIARDELKSRLSARQLADFNGPLGWQKESIALGRVGSWQNDKDTGARWGVRLSQPLVEARLDFSLERSELEDFERGAEDADFGPLEEAARQIASFEENTVYNGIKSIKFDGLLDKLEAKPVKTTTDPYKFAQAVGAAVTTLRADGIEGPYALVLGEKLYQAAKQLTNSGKVLISALAQLTSGPVLLSSALTGGVLMSNRGGDFELTVGQDLSVGYRGHTNSRLDLFLVETMTFRVLEPRAGVELKL